MKTLLIGGHTNGIGDTFADLWESRTLTANDLYVPNRHELDVTSQNSIGSYLRLHGPFRGIVYSAGINKLAEVEMLSFYEMNKTFEVNVYGFPVLLGAHLRMFPEDGGRAVQVVSDAAHTPMRNSLTYCASKTAAEMSVRVMARELYPRWVVAGVNPGVVEDTEMTSSVDEAVRKVRGWTPEEAQAYEDIRSVLGRRVWKDEVAETIWFALHGPEAINGSIITINGGK
jgi:NAD(P)-dependent dehydrogenase (short-subunit alcohol dehydrogenase family)